MHGADAGSTQTRLHRQGEVRRVDAHQHVGRIGQQLADQATTDAQQAWQMGQHLDETHHRQVLGRVQGTAAGVTHGGAGDADTLDLRRAPAQGSDQRRTQGIAGRLAGDQADPQPARVHRPRVAPATVRITE